MNAILKTIQRSLRELMLKFGQAYALEAYGPKSDVCVVWYEDGEVRFKTSSTHGKAGPGLLPCWEIRNKCGQSAMLKFGLPLPDESAHHVVMYPTASLLAGLGPIGFYKFLRDWPGRSKAGDVSVVEYSIAK